MAKIKITAPIMPVWEYEVCEYHRTMGEGHYSRDSGTPIRDDLARLIAAWYQSPTGVGSQMAALANGCEVDVDMLKDDIRATGDEFGWPADLECLLYWVEYVAEGL